MKQFGPWPIDPLAVLRRWFIRWYMPSSRETTEVIQPDEIDLRELPTQPGHPPGVAGAFHRGPVVQRVAPVLAVLAEVVWRHARNDCRLAAFVQQKLFGVGPHVGTVEGHKDRCIANEQHVLRFCKRLERLPLAVEQELPELDDQHFLVDLLLDSRDGYRLTLADVRRPVMQRGLTQGSTDRHEQGEVVQPGLFGFAVSLEFQA